MTAPLTIRLHPADNVVVARMDILPGTRVEGEVAAAPFRGAGPPCLRHDGCSCHQSRWTLHALRIVLDRNFCAQKAGCGSGPLISSETSRASIFHSQGTTRLTPAL